MNILADGAVAFLAAVGLSALLWLIAELVQSRRRSPVDAAVVLAARDSAEELEWAVWTAVSTSRALGRQTAVLIADCGMDDAARLRAEKLEENNSCVAVVEPSQIEVYFRR